MKLDLKDRKLLYWLDQNSRATNKELSKKIGLSQRGTAYKIEQLEKKGIIKKYVTFINTLSLGYGHYKVLLKLHNLSIEKEELLIKKLVVNPNIRWVGKCEGIWDINFSILAKSPEEFMEIYQKIEEYTKGLISEKMIHLVIKAPGFTKGYLIEENSKTVLNYNKSENSKDLNYLDLKILKSISQNARKSLVDLSKELKINLDTVRYHIKKLEKEGIISGYTLTLDYDKINIKRFSIYFNMIGMTKELENKIYEFAKFNNKFTFIVTMVGNYDLSLELEVLKENGVEEILKKFRKEFGEYIKKYEIIPITREYKYDFYPLNISKN